MDDRELEARLTTHLHRRFDNAPVPRGLAEAIRQGMTTQARPVGFSMRRRRFSFGWAIGAAAAIAMVALVAFNLRVPSIPGASGATPTPEAPSTSEPAGASDQVFVVIPAASRDVAALADQVNDQLAARLLAIGASGVGSFRDQYIVFTVPVTDEPVGDIRDILSAIGEIEFVGLPLSDYGVGKLQVKEGEPLPKAEPVLFGWEGIKATVRSGDVPNAVVTLTPAAADVFAAWTTNNVGGQVAIVVDGVVGIAPRINGPITGGEIELASGLENAGLFQRTVAILVAGELPDAWRNPTVVGILSRKDAEAAAKYAHPAGVVSSSAIAVITQAGFPRVVWRVNFISSVLMPDELVTIDAVTGQPIR